MKKERPTEEKEELQEVPELEDIKLRETQPEGATSRTTPELGQKGQVSPPFTLGNNLLFSPQELQRYKEVSSDRFSGLHFKENKKKLNA